MRLYFRGHRVRLSQKREARLARRVLFLSLILALAVSLTACLYHKAAPIAVENAVLLAMGKWESLAVKAVETVISEKNYTYQSLAFSEKDASGKTVAISVRSEALATLRSAITKELGRLLQKNERIPVSVPVGTLIAPHLFGGKGFDIRLNAMTYSSLRVTVVSEVFSVGINQTMHRLSLAFTTNTTLYCVREKKEFTHTFSAPLAEHLSFGTIPNAYFEYGSE